MVILAWIAKGSTVVSTSASVELLAIGNHLAALGALPVIAGSVYAAKRFMRQRARERGG